MFEKDQEVKRPVNQNKTFARRIAKTLTNSNKKALAEVLPAHSYSTERFKANISDKKYLEIGFGMGEHFVNLIKNNPSSLYIGAEVFINGVANVLKQLADRTCGNYLVWPDDIDLLIDQIPDNSLDGIYILFPDPWPKKCYLKRRLLNGVRLVAFKSKLKDGGFISFASDIEDYFSNVEQLFRENDDLIIEDRLYSDPHTGYIPTKYHLKAAQEERQPQFITAVLNGSA